MSKFKLGEKVTCKSDDGAGNIFYPDMVVTGVPAGDNKKLYAITPEELVGKAPMAIYQLHEDEIIKREANS